MLPLFEPSEHAEIRRLYENVCKACKVCKKHQRPANKPRQGGLWARTVNDIVASDVFKLDKHEIIHFIDLFSGSSVLFYVGSRAVFGQDILNAFASWTSIFGMPRCLFMDLGGEYTTKLSHEYLTTHKIKHLYSPPQSPFTNGVCERHNSICKVWLSKLITDCPTAPLSLSLSLSLFLLVS